MNKPNLDASPVAWMYKDSSGTMKMLGNTQLEEWVTKFGCKEIPLYTHPVKELTDEKIIEIANGCMVGATAWHNPELDPVKFAKAILKKAQEK